MFAVKILCVYIYIYIYICIYMYIYKYNYNILLTIKYDLLFKVIINYCHIPNVAYRFQLYIYI